MKTETQCMSFARGAVHNFQLLEKCGGIRVEGIAIEGFGPALTSCGCCCSLEVQQHVMVARRQEECVVKMSSVQGTSGGTGVLPRGLVV